MAPERWADWWASMWATGNETVAEASPLSDLPLLERLARAAVEQSDTLSLEPATQCGNQARRGL